VVKILAIDDTQDVIFALQKGLESLGYEVTTTTSGKEGLALAQKLVPDLILLDIMMPDISGWQVQKSLSQNETTKDIPVIFLTAKQDELSKQMGQNIAKEYIIKPIDIKELDKKIKKALT